MKLVINEQNLKNNDIEEYNTKARALLINKENYLLVVNYGGTSLLPGGSINDNENIEDCLIRELEEETGTKYNIEELNYLCHLDYFQKKYPKRNSEIKNRLITTHYYIGKYKDTLPDKINLTTNEKEGNLKLELIHINELENIIINNNNNNPRNTYFQKELLTILKYYKSTY